MSDKHNNKYSYTELACYRVGNVQYIPPGVEQGSTEYNEIVKNSAERGFDVRNLPTD